MGACRNCGRNAGFRADECDACRDAGAAAEAAAREVERRQAEAESAERNAAEAASVEIRRREYTARYMAIVEETVRRGDTATLLTGLYTTVDSEVDGDRRPGPRLDGIREMTLRGWRVAGVLPRTSGEHHTSRPDPGGAWSVAYAMGGNIEGAWVLLEFAVTAANLEPCRAMVERHFYALSEGRV